MRAKITKTLKLSLAGLFLFSLGACNQVSNMMNPFYESPKPVALLGEKNDHALNGERNKVDSARAALDSMASYRRAHEPQPQYPVMQPAIVRLMWVPDHLNQHGDLVPAHFYYLKVLDDRWAVTDAFELEAQLQGPAGARGPVSNVPFINADDKLNQ